jgi:type II secretory pathway predicted ATPase ExeA
MAGDINKAPNRPIRLRHIVADLGLSTNDIRKDILWPDGRQVSKTTISHTLNKGYVPGTVPNYKSQFEELLREYLVSEDVIKTMWQQDKSADVIPLGKHPKPTGKRTPQQETLTEAEMLTPTTMKNFRLFRNPFLDDVQKGSDVFMSESHSYAHAAMLDSARNGGFVAIIGECGAGKSIMRRKLISELQEAGDCRVIEPQTIDKATLTSGHILDAIIFDLDPDAKLRQSKEAKARQVRNALLASSRAGQRHVLIIEESHDLSVPTMKQLKRLWEIEDGYRKVLGIILVGQPELQLKLNRQTHPEMREVILRCLIGTLESLNRDDCERYINLKFDRIGKPIDEVLADGCMDAVMARLTARGGIPTVYPLYINNLLAKAMNAASQFGAPLVTPEIIGGV